MGVIELYGRLYDGMLVKQPVVPKEPDLTVPSVPLLEDAKDITLAQYDKYTKDILTAHRMKDYRRKRFNLVLLPDADILFDKILEGSDFWNALLHDESPYS